MGTVVVERHRVLCKMKKEGIRSDQGKQGGLRRSLANSVEGSPSSNEITRDPWGDVSGTGLVWVLIVGGTTNGGKGVMGWLRRGR